MPENIGMRIRELREARGLSRDIFCEEELELSIRQLTRIESGASLPSLSKIEFIAERLGVRVGELVDPLSLKLPDRYQELKYLILRTPAYQDKQRIGIRESYLEEISGFYDQIPEEEQIAVDCMQANLDVIASQDGRFGDGLLEDYFEQVKAKDYYNENDLLVLSLYLNTIFISKLKSPIFSEKIYKDIRRKLLSFKDTVDGTNFYLVNKMMAKLFAIDMVLEDFDFLEDILSASRQMMAETHDYETLPILNLMAWKHQLFRVKNQEAANQYYKDSVRFAEMVGDSYLIDNIKKEWGEDMENFRQNNL